ncbi:MAG: glycosyltransferase [Pseudomonadota bacterium]|nr:glycosyltransferase [Pseudomonadota bacterium]
MNLPTLLVFCHLRWNFVYQRPQHLLTRLASRYRVIVLEEPVHDSGPARLVSESPAPGVEVLRPHTPIGVPGFAAEQLALIGPLLQRALAERGVAEPLVWFYTPMALPLLQGLQPRAVVYDCMDELSAFRGAPPALGRLEAELLRRADLVLTGGPSLYEAKRGRAAKVLCVPSSVDAAHFAPPGADSTTGADDAWATQAEHVQSAIASPRLGFFGVIDERMDLALVDQLAVHDAAWQVVMAGPVVKIDPAQLPQRPNLHWLGQQPYALLPRLVASWQVCLLPFALNESTVFISPTKTLEYLAAGKPVVSTAVRDVGVLYGNGVQIADDAAGFIAACSAALNESTETRMARLATGAALVASGSWAQTAERVAQALAGVTKDERRSEPVVEPIA